MGFRGVTPCELFQVSIKSWDYWHSFNIWVEEKIKLEMVSANVGVDAHLIDKTHFYKTLRKKREKTKC